MTSTSELDKTRTQRVRVRQATKGDWDAQRRAEVLSPSALRDALTSPAGLRGVHRILETVHRGHIGQARVGDVADALDKLLGHQADVR